MAKRDYYEVLVVEKTATEGEIKKAYRKVALKFHPDRNQGDDTAEDKFKEAAEAYEVLGNPEKKAKYDRFGHAGVDGQGGFGGGGADMNMEDIFSNFGDIFGGGGGGSFFGGGGGGRGGRRVRKGSNLRVKVKLSLAEIEAGVEKKLKINKLVNVAGASYTTCTTCGGNGSVRRVTNTILGQMQTTTTCPTCNGSGQSMDTRPPGSDENGQKREERVVAVNIPAGVEDGMQLQVRSEGNEGPMNGMAGDLIVLIEETPHDHLVRDGQNVLYKLGLNFADAALGTSVEVPTINGKVKIGIPEGTQSGKVLRLKGKGLPSVNAYGKGDELIYVSVYTPKNLSKEEKTALQKFKKSENFEPKEEKADGGFFENVKDFFS
jgi:molecular chaperone DnaJ